MVTKQQVLKELEEVYDPEIMVNVVDLGLIYDIEIRGATILIKMTLTAPGCPAAEIIEQHVIERVNRLKGVKKVGVEFVWEPLWHPSMMSEAARLALGYEI